jgi:hypothetical protein
MGSHFARTASIVSRRTSTLLDVLGLWAFMPLNGFSGSNFQSTANWKNCLANINLMLVKMLRISDGNILKHDSLWNEIFPRLDCLFPNDDRGRFLSDGILDNNLI